MVSAEELVKERDSLQKEITSLIISYQHKEISYDEYIRRKKGSFVRLNEINRILQ